MSTEPGTGLFFSATSGADFTVLDHKAVTFAANETVKTVSVNIVNDNVSEGNEKFYLVMNESASSSSKVSGVYDSVWITPASGALASQGAPNAGALAAPIRLQLLQPLKLLFQAIRKVFFNDSAFAAKTSNGQVVSWGNQITVEINRQYHHISRMYQNL